VLPFFPPRSALALRRGRMAL